MHNHPWLRAHSLVLKGSYDETRAFAINAKAGQPKTHKKRVRFYNRLTALDWHRIDELFHGPVWTLFITVGGKQNKWGYWYPHERGPEAYTEGPQNYLTYEGDYPFRRDE